MYALAITTLAPQPNITLGTLFVTGRGSVNCLSSAMTANGGTGGMANASRRISIVISRGLTPWYCGTVGDPLGWLLSFQLTVMSSFHPFGLYWNTIGGKGKLTHWR